MLYVFCPSILAHSGLVTSDLTASLAFVVSLGTMWMAMHRVECHGRVLASAVAMGCLLVSKFSALVILPVALILIVTRLLAHRPMIVKLGKTSIVTTWQRQLGIIGAVACIHAAAVLFIVWMSYGFHYATFRDARAGRDQMIDGATIESLTGDDLFGTVVRLRKRPPSAAGTISVRLGLFRRTIEGAGRIFERRVQHDRWPSFFPVLPDV